jgi:hypothetical protein
MSEEHEPFLDTYRALGLEDQDRKDLAKGRLRVVGTCFTCPFLRPDGEGVVCSHPATEVPPEPLKVVVSLVGIPQECPLRVAPLTVFLEETEL